MMQSSTMRRLAMAGAAAVAALAGAVTVLTPQDGAAVEITADHRNAPLAPTTSAAPSYAPANPVDCTDPNNAINCDSPPIDSPLVVGTAEPGSPYRD